MIQLRRLSGDTVLINPDHIRFIEKRPDTIVTFADGKTLIVRESPEEITQLMLNYRRQVTGSNQLGSAEA